MRTCLIFSIFDTIVTVKAIYGPTFAIIILQENIAAGEFYWPHPNPSKFVQCDEWGGCFVMPCPPGLTWQQEVKVCTGTGSTTTTSAPRPTTTRSPPKPSTTTRTPSPGYNCSDKYTPCTRVRVLVKDTSDLQLRT